MELIVFERLVKKSYPWMWILTSQLSPSKYYSLCSPRARCSLSS